MIRKCLFLYVCWVPGVKETHLCKDTHLCGVCREVKASICRCKKCKEAREEQNPATAVIGGLFESHSSDPD